jgi:hypothetical protein
VSETKENAGGRGYRLGELTCAACGEKAELFAAGWRDRAAGERYTDELPALEFYCPDCAAPGSDS